MQYPKHPARTAARPPAPPGRPTGRSPLPRALCSRRTLSHSPALDPTSRVACETMVTTDFVCVAGEITTSADLSRKTVDRIVRDVVREIGYVDPNIGFAADTCQVECRLHAQSGNIAQGVDV